MEKKEKRKKKKDDKNKKENTVNAEILEYIKIFPPKYFNFQIYSVIFC